MGHPRRAFRIKRPSNLVTQPGETDNFTVADHVKVLNEYMKTRKVDIVITNNGEMDHETIDNYSLNEHKSPVVVDIDKLKKLGVKVISEKLATI
ncbi:MAG: YvcK family protein, partial [Clostridia bacterium]|nr:YvcK family protein [Clostridia bacterium]